MGVDVLGALIPGVPAAGTVKRVGKYTGKLINKADDVADARKLIPNPHGRKGGIVHQKGVETAKRKAEAEFKGQGVQVKTEKMIKTPGGYKNTRYGDVVAFDQSGKPIKAYQVGDVTKGGKPVARERRALEDIRRSGVPAEFYPKIEQ